MLEGMKSASLLGALVVDLAINWFGWAAASVMRTEKFYDITGSLTYITVAVGTYFAGGASLTRPGILTGMVVLWATRLGSFLLVRVLRDKGDRRFDEAKHKPGLFFIYWTMQAVWVFVTALPVLIANGSANHPPLGLLDFAGVGLWVAGLAVETMADVQKFVFRASKDNHGKFIRTGLWKYSRHPNYFGEIVLWWGTFVVAASSLQGWQWACMGSPAFVALLLTRVSGVPILEKAADKKWAGDKEYLDYKESTSILVPLPPRSTK